MRTLRVHAVRVAFVLVAALALAAGPALAKGPSGSSENKSNVVKCNHDNGQSNGGLNVYQGGNGVFLGPSGIEVCSDDDSSIDGRLILTCEGMYASADGDSSNPEDAQGWARLSSAGPETGGESDPKQTRDNDVSDGKKGAC